MWFQDNIQENLESVILNKAQNRADIKQGAVNGELCRYNVVPQLFCTAFHMWFGDIIPSRPGGDYESREEIGTYNHSDYGVPGRGGIRDGREAGTMADTQDVTCSFTYFFYLRTATQC